MNALKPLDLQICKDVYKNEFWGWSQRQSLQMISFKH